MTFNLDSRSPQYSISFRPVIYESAIVDNLGAGGLSSKNKYKAQRKDIPHSHAKLLQLLNLSYSQLHLWYLSSTQLLPQAF